MILPTIPQAALLKWLGVVLVLGLIYSFGYFKGYSYQSKSTERALRELVESEKELARVASQLATQASQKVTQAVERATTTRREYESAPVHEVDPVNCVSPEQRRLLSEASRNPTKPSL